MKKLMEQMAEELSAAFEKSGYDPSYGKVTVSAFEKSGYDPSYGKVTVSNRPDLCEFQCNGAMAGAKAYKKAPFMIADDVVAYLKDSQVFSMAEVVKPGFINLKVKGEFLADYLKGSRRETFRICSKRAEDDHHRLRWTKRCKTSSCRTPSFCNHRRKY